MDWSFHYLRGATEFWHWKDGKIMLTMNPLKQKNSHGHHKNHPEGIVEIDKFITGAKKSGEGIVTFYPWIGQQEDVLQLYQQMFIQGASQGIHQIWIRTTKHYPYFVERTGLSNLDPVRRWLGMYDSDFGTLREQTSLRMYKNRNDLLADLRIFDRKIEGHLALSFTDADWWYKTEDCMSNIFDILAIDIDSDRLKTWRPIMLSWREKVLEMVDWYENKIPQITQAVIDDREFDLTGFDLDILAQATIMTHLMKDHGRRLILPDENFPKNAKELHKFLK